MIAPDALRRLFVPFALALCVAAFAGCESPTSDAPGNDTSAPMSAEAQSAMAALPAEARLLAVADAQALRRGGFFAGKGRADLSGETGARIRDFLNATGFDPKEDVRKAYVAVPGAGGAGKKAPPQIALAADFERARFEQELGGTFSNRFEQEAHRGQPVYRSTGQQARGLAFALTADGLILLSDVQGVRQMLDRLATREGSAAGSDRLMQLAEPVRGRGDAWFVARGLPGMGDGRAKMQGAQRSNAPAAAQRFQHMKRVVEHAAWAVYITTDRVAEGTLFLHTKQGAAPADLREVLEGIASAAGRNDGLSEKHRQALESLEIEEQSDAVRVGFSFPMEK